MSCKIISLIDISTSISNSQITQLEFRNFYLQSAILNYILNIFILVFKSKCAINSFYITEHHKQVGFYLSSTFKLTLKHLYLFMSHV